MLALKSIGEILQMLGERVTAERLSQNITQRDLALRSGVAYSTLRKIESNGEGSMGNYVALLQALRLVDQIEQFLPPHQFDPELVHKMQGLERQRARRRK
jgi:putative transcriptional regulator